jgi:anaerobic magnesium-protoporphyrin IX monomethyl ester cyclase
MADCLIIGFNDSEFAEFVGMTQAMGLDSGAYRDLNLAYVDHEGRPYRSMDLLSLLHGPGGTRPERGFSNTDFLWPTILYLGSFLERHGFSFDYVNRFQAEREELRAKLERGDVLTVAITTTLYVSPQPILEIISFIRGCDERVKIVVGGPYVANQVQMIEREGLQQLFGFIGADYYVISQEGEQTLAQLLAALKSGAGCGNVPNLAYREGGGYVFTGESLERNTLEENPVDYARFGAGEVGEFVSLRTAKSCPFSCAFCGFPQRAGKYTYLAVDLVEQELNRLADLGSVSTITFLDDTFNVPKPRFKELLRMMIRNRYGFRWNSFYRSDHGDEEAIELMRDAGCEGVFLGVESGSDAMLKRMNKSSRRQHYMKAIPLFRQAGISTYASFIVGFPGETEETVEETLSLVEEARPEYFRAQLWYCDPMTPIWHRREEFGVQGSAFNWSHATMDQQMACDLIDRVFLAASGAIWLPQNGFEQWSTFYLQRRGFSKPRLNEFLRRWNEAVREQLLAPERETISPPLLARLAAVCRPDGDGAASLPAALDAAPGPAYRRAERYWRDELARPAGGDLRQALRAAAAPAGDPVTWRGRAGAAVAALADGLGAGAEVLAAAAFGSLLSRVAGQEGPWLIATVPAAPGSPRLVPVRVPEHWDATFAELVQRLGAQARLAAEHARYARPLLHGPLRRSLGGAAVPAVQAACLVASGGAVPVLGEVPELAREVGLELRVDPRDGGWDLELHAAAGWCGPGALHDLGAYLLEILAQAAGDPAVVVGEIALGGVAQAAGRGAPAGDEAFDF